MTMRVYLLVAIYIHASITLAADNYDGPKTIPEAIFDIQHLCKSPSIEDRQMAALMLNEFGLEIKLHRAMPTLTLLLNDRNEAVRGEAILALDSYFLRNISSSDRIDLAKVKVLLEREARRDRSENNRILAKERLATLEECVAQKPVKPAADSADLKQQ